MEQNINVGLDDGHDSLKACIGYDAETKQFDCRVIKSVALSGLHQIVALNGGSSAYETGNEIFTVAGENALGRYLDTRFMDYPKSALNRVLVQHALINAGFAGKTVTLATGLPVDQYYVGGKVNEPLIAAKTANLLEPVLNLNESIRPVTVTNNRVISEGIAAIYDAILNGDGTPNIELVELIGRRPIAVVDLGGKTLDIATISEKAAGIYKDKSGTEDIGVISMKEKVAALIKDKFNLNNDPPAKYVEEAFRTKKYELFGKQEDVSDILDACGREYLALVKNFFLSKVGDGSDVGAVIFVGGGAALLRFIFGESIFAEVYRGKIIVPANPEYSNAIGMWKALNFLK